MTNYSWRRMDEGQETRTPMHCWSEKDLLGHKLWNHHLWLTAPCTSNFPSLLGLFPGHPPAHRGCDSRQSLLVLALSSRWQGGHYHRAPLSEAGKLVPICHRASGPWRWIRCAVLIDLIIASLGHAVCSNLFPSWQCACCLQEAEVWRKKHHPSPAPQDRTLKAAEQSFLSHVGGVRSWSYARWWQIRW